MISAMIWAIRKAFQCILHGGRFLLANHTRLSPTSENESCLIMQFLISIDNLDENLPAEEIGAMQQNTIRVLLSLSLIFYVQSQRFFFLNVFRYFIHHSNPTSRSYFVGI